jgi:hypothetical protein
VSERVRQSMRQARRAYAEGDPAPQTRPRKLASVRVAAGHSVPAADIDEMPAEIGAGYEER